MSQQERACKGKWEH